MPCYVLILTPFIINSETMQNKIKYYQTKITEARKELSSIENSTSKTRVLQAEAWRDIIKTYKRSIELINETIENYGNRKR